MIFSRSKDRQENALLSVPESNQERRARAWLAARLERAENERYSQDDVLVTPEMADELLKINFKNNRRINRALVSRLVYHLQNGTWELQPHGIVVNKYGELDDGQHRLTAISESRIAGRMQITYGTEPRERDLIDTGGKQRTGADIMRISGETHSALRAATISQMLYYKYRGKVHPDPILIKRHSGDWGSYKMDESLRQGDRLKKICTPSAASVAYLYILLHTKKDESVLRDFWDGLVSGENIRGLLARTRDDLQRPANWPKVSRDANCKKAAAIILAWNNSIKPSSARKNLWQHVTFLPEPL